MRPLDPITQHLEKGGKTRIAEVLKESETPKTSISELVEEQMRRALAYPPQASLGLSSGSAEAIRQMQASF